ncbi:uncharacterized protein LOC132281510 [Cornus florida]|uniref:uncharacterized protein LOC132281510 n=1 Tax=Cornus florida TaxID=4283 RepID=UPI00289B8394|nr:uncharacterized protein LOC132281510 [Cornus florida]
MAGIGSLVDLLLFYTLERVLFNRMVSQMCKNPQSVKMAMSLWLMLEEIGYYDLTRMVNSFDDSTIETIFKESLACLECIQPDAVEPTESDDTPVFVSLFDEPMSRRFFYYNREFMYRRYNHTMDTVCNKIFGERSAIEVYDQCSAAEAVVRPVGEGTSGAAGTLLAGGSGEESCCRGGEAPKQSTLNPNASDFVPGQTRDDTRTMFLTFSRGFPLSREEIIHFFTSYVYNVGSWRWGDVVQDVVVEQAGGGVPPLYGRIIFKTAMIIPIILNGQAKAKFLLGRKHLWARIYVPRHQR